jgi:hypothetical protein
MMVLLFGSRLFTSRHGSNQITFRTRPGHGSTMVLSTSQLFNGGEFRVFAYSSGSNSNSSTSCVE